MPVGKLADAAMVPAYAARSDAPMQAVASLEIEQSAQENLQF